MHAFVEDLNFWRFSILILNTCLCYVFPAIGKNSSGKLRCEFSFGTLDFPATDWSVFLLLSGDIFRGTLCRATIVDRHCILCFQKRPFSFCLYRLDLLTFMNFLHRLDLLLFTVK